MKGYVAVQKICLLGMAFISILIKQTNNTRLPGLDYDYHIPFSNNVYLMMFYNHLFFF